MGHTDAKLSFSCRHCGHEMRTRPERAGRTVHCMKCRCAVRIPGLPPAPPALTALRDSGDTMVGEEAAFATQILPAISDIEIIETNRLPEPELPTTLSRGMFTRVSLPIGTGMAIAACLLLGLMIALKSAGGPKRATAAPPVEPPATNPAMEPAASH